MKEERRIRIITSATAALLLGACTNLEFTHVKPGHSARAMVASRENPPPPTSIVSMPGGLPVPAENAELAPMPLPPPPVDIVPAPALPDPSSTGERVAELYTRGSLAMKAGKTGEAILALEEAVELDPSFSDAWTKLVLAYQEAGMQDKAIAAYKRAKQLGQPNGSAGRSGLGEPGLLP